MYDVRQLLKRYGIFIYTGDRLNDLHMIKLEINELYALKVISIKEYEKALLIIHREFRHFS